MDDLGFLALTIILLSIALFLISPRKIRHWIVLAFVGVTLGIIVLGLPQRFFVILFGALALWVTGIFVSRQN